MYNESIMFQEGGLTTMKYVSGIHHTAIRCHGEEEMKKAVSVYTDLFGMDLIRSWGEGKSAGAMVDAGGSILEFFADADEGRTYGIVDHVALSTDDVDAALAMVREAGFHVTQEANDVTIPSNPPLPIRCAFFEGGAGESIELFCIK